MFTYYHADKRSITLDTRRAESLPALEELGNTADVIVISPSRRRPLAGFDEATPRGVVGTRERGGLCDHALRPHRSVPASPRHTLRRVRDQRVDAQGRARGRSTGHHPGTAALGRSECARRRVHPGRIAEPRRSRRPNDRHLGARSGSDARLRFRPVRRDGHDAGSHRGRSAIHQLVRGSARTVRSTSPRIKRATGLRSCGCSTIPPSSRILRSKTSSYAGRSSTVWPRRSPSCWRTATAANSSSGANRSACPAPS